MTEHDLEARQVVGLATYDVRNPEATYRPIQPGPPPSRRHLPAAGWPFLVLAVWLGNGLALALAGMVLTDAGSIDPLVYVEWGAGFALVNAGLHVAGCFWRPPASLAGRLPRPWRDGPLTFAVLAVVAFAADLVLVWAMTATAPPPPSVHRPDLTAIARVAAVMWAANVPVGLLLRLRLGALLPRQEEREAV